jgi:hypothetical protein
VKKSLATAMLIPGCYLLQVHASGAWCPPEVIQSKVAMATAAVGMLSPRRFMFMVATYRRVHPQLFSVTSCILMTPTRTPGKFHVNLLACIPLIVAWFVDRLLLMQAPSARFLHSAVISRGLMLVFGGNTHNDTAFSHGAKCYSSDFLAYDIACDSWTTLATPKLTRADLSRFGHSAVTFEGSLYIYGGFNGQLLSDLLRYTPGRCNSLDEARCRTLKPGVKCVWDNAEKRCKEAGQSVGLGTDQCDVTPERTELCAMLPLPNCEACVQTSHGCVWCGEQGGGCSYAKCKDPALKVNPHNRLLLY